MEENRPGRDLDTENPNTLHGDDYEYDEAHDVLAGPLGETPRHIVSIPRPRRWTSARAATMDTTRHTISPLPEEQKPDIA